MSGENISPDGRWEVIRRIKRHSHAFFESDTSWEIVLRNTATREVIKSFDYSEYGNSEGWTYDGLRGLEFAPDGASVTATYTDGEVETIALPPPDKAK